jgi:hypothetical protein
MSGGLHEATVESRRAARAGYLHVSPIERKAPRLVNVESVVEHATDYAGRLANSENQDFARSRRAFK